MAWFLLISSSFGFGFFAGDILRQLENNDDENFTSSVGFLLLFFILSLHFFSVA
jgi:hypothetical protein